MKSSTASRSPCHFRSGEGSVRMILGMPHIMKVCAEQSEGGTSVYEVIIGPGQGVPPHTHSREDEYFSVLSGQLTFLLEGKSDPLVLEDGGFLFAPRGRWHGFRNDGARPARMLVAITPGASADRLFAALDLACPKAAGQQEAIKAVTRICGEYGIAFATPI